MTIVIICLPRVLARNTHSGVIFAYNTIRNRVPIRFTAQSTGDFTSLSHTGAGVYTVDPTLPNTVYSH